MKSFSSPKRLSGFTLVELLVVILIMSLVLTFASNLLRGVDKTKGIQSGVDLLENTITEAREIAKGRGTWTRVVIPVTPDDASPKSRHLKYAAVIAWEPTDETDLNLKPMGDETEWKMLSQGVDFPAGVYLSTELSKTEADPEITKSGEPITAKTCRAKIGKGASVDCYYIEFDRMGRMTWPRGITKVVLMSGVHQLGRDIVPAPKTADGKPAQVAGFVIFPQGQVSRLHNNAQIFGSNTK